MIAALRTSVCMGVLMTFLLGILYPAVVWTGGRVFFADKAKGSLIETRGKIVGSSLIGQLFTQDRYFHGRPSATPRTPYNAQSSGASHLNPSNPVLLNAVAARVKEVGNVGEIPVDSVTTSGSGLDPHISLKAAHIQAQKIAKARNVPERKIHALIDATTETPTFGFLGQSRVNVLLLNLALDRL